MKRNTKKSTAHPSLSDRNATIPIPDAAKALLFALGATLLLLLAASLVAYFSPDPNLLVLPLGLGVAAIISFLGGYLTLCFHRRSAFVCGLTFAILITLLLLPLSFLPASRRVGYPLWASCLLRCSVFALSVSGSFCALRRIERAPKRKRHKHA